MTKDEFVAIIQYYGEPNICGILFDNSAAKLFSDGEFSLANSLVDITGDVSVLQFVEMDRKNLPFHVVKLLSDIQGFIIKDSGVKYIADYDRITLRG